MNTRISETMMLAAAVMIWAMPRTAALAQVYYQPYEYYEYELEVDDAQESNGEENAEANNGESAALPMDFGDYSPAGEHGGPEDYGKWYGDNYNLDYEMNVPGYDYEGYMVFEERGSNGNGEYEFGPYDYRRQWNQYRYTKEELFGDDDDDVDYGEGWYDDDYYTLSDSREDYDDDDDDDNGDNNGDNGNGDYGVYEYGGYDYDYDYGIYDYGYGADGDVAGNGYNYYTDDWYEYDDPFSDWIDSL